VFLGQTEQQDGVVFGLFANCPLLGGVRRVDPDVQSAVFVLEHPTEEQRKWQLQNPNYDLTVRGAFLWFRADFCVHVAGFMHARDAPESGMSTVYTRFMSLKPPGPSGWSLAQIERWELWRV
jgi:hypothetical protein